MSQQPKGLKPPGERAGQGAGLGDQGWRQMVFALINTIFAQETAKVAHAQWRVVSDQLREKFPRLADLRVGTELEALPSMDFPNEHRLKIHNTNVLERLNREIKRRADVVGLFPNEATIRRLVGALLLEQNDPDAIQRRHMSMESMTTASEQPAIRLAVALALA